MNFKRRLMNSAVVGVLLAVGFLIMASIFVPERLEAGLDESATTTPHSAEATGRLPSLGQLESEHYVVKAFASGVGPLYSVFDHRGVELATLLTADQVAVNFPDLPLPDVRADGSTKVMDASGSESEW